MKPGAGASPFVPLLLVLAAALAWAGVQAWQLLRQQAVLGAQRAEQQAALRQAEQSRAALDALAAQTQRLADAGNVPALIAIGELRRRGVTIDALTPALPAPTGGR